jgi:AcrR family transcriptional regulator
MPKPTFFNLPDAKRDALVRIALEEFADQPYEAASVSRIVANAGIAKGSLYQYFEDKQDLFEYLIAHASETLITEIGAAYTALPPHAGLFEQLRVLLHANVRAAHAHPVHARVIHRAFTGPVSHSGKIITRGEAQREARLQDLLAAAQARGELRADVPLAVASFALSRVLAHLPELIAAQLGRPLSEIDPTQLDTPEVNTLIDSVLTVLCAGIAKPGQA